MSFYTIIIRLCQSPHGTDHEGVIRISLVPRPEKGRRKRAWFPLFAHALNRGGIPPAPRTFDSCPYPRDVKADTKRYVVRTAIVVSEYGVRFYSTDLDCATKPHWTL